MDDELKRFLEGLVEADKNKREEYLIRFPLDVPNQIGHSAFIRGISFENSSDPSVGEYYFLFETEYEKLYIWTHTRNRSSALISDIDISIKNNNFWKTAGSLIYLSLAYDSAFESVDFDNTYTYEIMYEFSPSIKLEEITFFNTYSNNLLFISSGRQIKATDLANLAPVIDLINNDDRCFTALSLLVSSFQLHYCCLICELGLYPYKKHESHEPEMWEQTDLIPRMESAIIQACRCAESILGEPPSLKKRSKILQHKQRWIDLVGINADEQFEISGLSYWEFYLKLFDEFRNPSAHSYGNIHFDLKRKHTIESQCFAALILRGYIERNSKDFEDALNSLNFNTDFLNRVQLNISTTQTR